MNQMRYDGFQDAWTMSILFAPDEEPPKSSDDDDDDEIYPSHNIAINEYTPLEISEHVEPLFPLVPPSTGKEDVLYSAQASNEDMEFMYSGGSSLKRWKNPDDFETIMTSRYFFGYNPYRMAPIPGNVNIHDELKIFSKNLGQFPLSASSSSMQGSRYFSQMAYYLHLLDKIYQCNQNRDYRAFQRIFHVANSRIQIKLFCISKSGEKLYSVIPFKNTSDVAYTLVVPNVMTAFEIVVRDWSHSIREIARQLILQGIPFHTLLTAEEATRVHKLENKNVESKECPTQIICKSTEEILRRADIVSYKEKIKAVLQLPRGRKALMIGRIPW